MLNFAMIGVGRIGEMHARNIVNHPLCDLTCVYDINSDSASRVAKLLNVKIAKSPEEAIDNNNVDAVFIASATNTHVDYIILAAKSQKAVFCEKPVDLDIEKINYCYEQIKDLKVPIQIGFNRRFDQSHQKLKLSKDNGEIGKLEMIVITSRDPAPPNIDYLKNSGGLFRDCTIHDFDLSRFILGEDPIVEISAYGSQLVSDEIKNINDHDTAMFILRSQNGVLCHINNSRRAVYGYDQRVEIFGSKGMLISTNQTPISVEKNNASGSNIKEPLYHFFIERYDQAYKNQLNDFVGTVIDRKQSSVTLEDGRNALILANAAYRSLETGKSIQVIYD